MAAADLSTVALAGQRGLAIDAKSLDRLGALAGKDQRAALKETARQFEALFMKELLKSMRDATLKSGLIDNEQSDLGTEMLDQQFAQQLTGLPGGLSEMIERQLSRQIGADAGAAKAPGGAVRAPGAAALAPRAALPSDPVESTNDTSTTPTRQPTAAQARFVDAHRDAALAVARESGIPAAFMLGQAAHETGWGQSEIRSAEGAPSFNLFGIKAGSNWKGPVAEVNTTEYIDGQPRKVTARFRAYASYEESFRDYARLIGNSPRYQAVMDSLHSARAFAQGLQRAGYATDPQYAAKLSQVINTTLRLQRAQA